ncbi:MAG TPA: hypothetical protein VGR53_09880 [Nitrososphaerales archaeon]|nr:hypothetical protein [Nitrososphaerales archaeon]
MSLKRVLKDKPVIYEIVPPRANSSRFGAELRGVEMVMHDGRINAINIPELINRRESDGQVTYSPATILPEEYALLVSEYKDPIVNIIAPRLTREAFQNRVHAVLGEYGLRGLVIVGKERHEDVLPGPSVVEALEIVREQRHEEVAVGGICIFNRRSKGGKDYGVTSNLEEHRRMWVKGSRGCDFVTSQINFDASAAADCLAPYQDLCERTGVSPMTVFLSMSAVPSKSILSLLERLDVVFPPPVRKRLVQASDIAMESVKVATEVFMGMLESLERRDVEVPIGLQVEQIGVRSEELTLELLDNIHDDFKRA